MSLISLTTAVLTVLISGNFVFGSLTAPAGIRWSPVQL
jgi:hypothetical protein